VLIYLFSILEYAACRGVHVVGDWIRLDVLV
jgi:hypothetical protein